MYIARAMSAYIFSIIEYILNSITAEVIIPHPSQRYTLVVHLIINNTIRYIIRYTYIYIVIVIFIWWSPFILSRNLDEVFTYNHIWL